MEIGERLVAANPEDFAAWLAEHGTSAREIWVLIYKKASGKQTVTYEQLVEVALCHGWIDGQMKSLDAERYAQRFSPRRKRSNWTAANRVICPPPDRHRADDGCRSRRAARGFQLTAACEASGRVP